jgi:MFS family permease
MKTTTPAATTVLSRTTLLLMATACGLCAGANYFNQPLLNSMVQHLQISDAQASSTVTMAQVSYGGTAFLVPLGDMLERRRLVLTLMLLAACGMLLSGISGLAGSFALLAAGTLMAGVFSVAAQVLVPMAPPAAPGARAVPSGWS